MKQTFTEYLTKNKEQIAHWIETRESYKIMKQILTNSDEQ